MDTLTHPRKHECCTLAYSGIAVLTLCISCTPTEQIQQKQPTGLAVSAPDWPHIRLERYGWTIFVADPTAESPYYQAMRFAQSGMMPQIYHRFVQITGSPKKISPGQSLQHDDVGGLIDEFDIKGPPDFAGTAPLQPFLKIGVGWLKRPDEKPYRFGREYQRLTAPTITLLCDHDSGSITFLESLTSPAGHPTYTMRTTLEIKNSTLTSRRSLTNMSDVPLITEFYNHNFLQIADIPPGPSYTLKWSHTLQNINFKDAQQFVRIEHNSLHYNTNIPPSATCYLEFKIPETAQVNNFTATLHEAITGISIEITTDQPLHRFAIWGNNQVICPEPFIQLKIAPGETATWSTTYTIRHP